MLGTYEAADLGGAGGDGETGGGVLVQPQLRRLRALPLQHRRGVHVHPDRSLPRLVPGLIEKPIQRGGGFRVEFNFAMAAQQQWRGRRGIKRRESESWRRFSSRLRSLEGSRIFPTLLASIPFSCVPVLACAYGTFPTGCESATRWRHFLHVFFFVQKELQLALVSRDTLIL